MEEPCIKSLASSDGRFTDEPVIKSAVSCRQRGRCQSSVGSNCQGLLCEASRVEFRFNTILCNDTQKGLFYSLTGIFSTQYWPFQESVKCINLNVGRFWFTFNWKPQRHGGKFARSKAGSSDGFQYYGWIDFS